ncbi:MAG: TauD/TfdA family dioxygenase [Candidatus Sericytochromatia bacterium]
MTEYSRSPLARLEPAGLASDLLEQGALMLRARASLEEFLAFSARCAASWGPFVEQGSQQGQQQSVGGNSGRSTVAGLASLFTTTGRTQGHPVPLHGELYFQQRRPPELLWFYCAQAPESDGMTWLCDGISLFAALPQPIQAQLSQRRLVYQRRLDCAYWQQYGKDPEKVLEWFTAQGYAISWNEDGSLSTCFMAPALIERGGEPVFINNLLPFGLRQIQTPEATRARVCFEGEQPIAPELVLEIEAIAAGLTRAVAWQAGDVVLVDNTRTLHGRGAVSGSQREVYVRMSQAGFLAELLEAEG